MGQSDSNGLSDIVAELVAAHPTMGLAAVVVRLDQPPQFACYGRSTEFPPRSIDPETVFRIASITKTFTAIAIVQLAEQGLLDLDDPAQSHLKQLRIHSDGFSAPTLRHLLTHTAGLAELARPWYALLPDFGESRPLDQPLPSLTEFYGGQVKAHAEPGTRFVYTNHAPAILGQVVADVSGLTLADYLRQQVFAPLGMTDTTLTRSPQVRAALATGYEIGARGVTAVTEREMVTAGAASAYSTPADMAKYITALLRGGRGPIQAILTADSLADMMAAHYQPDPRVPGVGLAFFRHRLGEIEVVGHQGTHPGFHSQFLLAPGRDAGVAVLCNGTKDPDFWLPSAATRILAATLDVAPHQIRSDLPLHPEVWSSLCGWYALSALPTDTRLRGMLGLGVEIFVANGQLRLRFLTPIPQLAHGFELLPDAEDDPYVFRADLGLPGMEPLRFVFTHDAGTVTAIVMEAMPVVLPRRSGMTNPRRWASAGLAAAALTTAAIIGRRTSTHRRRIT